MSLHLIWGDRFLQFSPLNSALRFASAPMASMLSRLPILSSTPQIPRPDVPSISRTCSRTPCHISSTSNRVPCSLPFPDFFSCPLHPMESLQHRSERVLRSCCNAFYVSYIRYTCRRTRCGCAGVSYWDGCVYRR